MEVFLCVNYTKLVAFFISKGSPVLVLVFDTRMVAVLVVDAPLTLPIFCESFGTAGDSFNVFGQPVGDASVTVALLLWLLLCLRVIVMVWLLFTRGALSDRR